MKLARALGLSGGEAVAFVGAGGKTSTMFALAAELPPPVILTTSTHLGDWQAQWADRHFVLSTAADFKELNFQNATTVLLTGSADSGDRLAGLTPDLMHTIGEYCREKGISLLIEADGARQRPLKAPAAYEPAIPPWVDHVVVTAGLAGLGQPLNAETVHRPEIFTHLTGLHPGEDIKTEHLVTVLGSPSGGLKGIPEGAGRYVFLNQADDEMCTAQAARMAEELCKTYDRVLIGSTQQPGPEGPVFSTISQSAGIILAAGGSERLGRPKQLLDWNGQPFIVQVVGNAISAGLDPVIVVTGADEEKVVHAVGGLPVNFIHNPHWAGGQSTSMKAGLAALPQNCDRAMFLLSDQPQISPLLIRALIERHNEQRAPITAPMIRERRGNPVLFGSETFAALSAITGDQGGREVFNQFKVDWLSWIDDRALLDVDQDGDYEKLINAYHEPS